MAEQEIDVVNANDDVTVHINGNKSSVVVGAAGKTGVFAIVNSDKPDSLCARFDGRGRLFLGGGGVTGRIVGFHPEGKHGDEEGSATITLDSKRGLIELGSFASRTGSTSSIRMDGGSGEIVVGGEHTGGIVRALNDQGKTTIKLSGEQGRITSGGNSVEGSLVVQKGNGLPAIQAEADGSVLRFHGTLETDGRVLAGNNPTGPVTISLDGHNASATIGSANHHGLLSILADNGEAAIRATGTNATVTLGSRDNAGSVSIKNREGTNKISLSGDNGRVSAETGRFREVFAIDPAGNNLIQMDGPDATIRCGGPQRSGTLSLQASGGGETVVVSSANANITLGNSGNGGSLNLRNDSGQDSIIMNGHTGSASFGRSGESGQLFVRNSQGENAIVINGDTANVGIGTAGLSGNMFIKSNQGEDTIVFNGSSGNAGIGGNGQDGDLFVKDREGNNMMHLRAATGNVGIGGHGQSGDVFIKDKDGNNNIHLQGESGDIILTNADCAEEFDVDTTSIHEAGTVMTIDEFGVLCGCQQAYDTRVAGVVSGAGRYKPGILLDRNGDSSKRRPIALVGKVYCKVDASGAPINVGDLLTTSSTPGYAMKAVDPSRAPGAVIGKALSPQENGKGLIPILVALQ